jgi:ketosteroid isomerase-like protein
MRSREGGPLCDGGWEMDHDLDQGQAHGLDQERRLADFGRRWVEAELRGDVSALDALLTDDFTAVGPRGFVLDKKKWLDRYASGSLVHDSFTWDEVTVRQYGGSAVAVGVQGQQSVFDGRDADGDFRVTQMIVEVDGHWRLAAVHLSPTGVRGQ